MFIRICNSRTAANSRRFLRDLERTCPLRIRTILTERDMSAIGPPWSAIGPRTMARGKEFTDRLFGLRKRSPSGKHAFDQLCTDLAIEHRLAPPAHPQTNGRIECFNGRIEEVLQSHHFRSGEELQTTLHRYVAL